MPGNAGSPEYELSEQNWPWDNHPADWWYANCNVERLRLNSGSDEFGAFSGTTWLH